MRILFIGGTGNISTDCAALLREGGHDIAVLTRGHASIPSSYRAVRADRKDAAAMRTALEGLRPEVVINFLGYDLRDVQLDCELFRGAVRQYIFISTAMVYAKPHRQLPLTESAPLGNPFSEYAQKKLACEEWLRTQTALPATVVRPSHTYSSRWFPNCVSSAGWTFPARLLAGRAVFVPDEGTTPWTLTHTSDFAVGLAGLVGHAQAIGEAFHITSDEALTWPAVYAETAAALGAMAPVIEKIPTDWLCERFPQFTSSIRGDKANPAVFDNAKLRRFVPSFRCRKPFHTGIRESVAWYRAHPAAQVVDEKLDEMWDSAVQTSTRREIGLHKPGPV